MSKGDLREDGSLHPNGEGPDDGSGCGFIVWAIIIVAATILGFIYGPDMANWIR